MLQITRKKTKDIHLFFQRIHLIFLKILINILRMYQKVLTVIVWQILDLPIKNQ